MELLPIEEPMTSDVIAAIQSAEQYLNAGMEQKANTIYRDAMLSFLNLTGVEIIEITCNRSLRGYQGSDWKVRYACNSHADVPANLLTTMAKIKNKGRLLIAEIKDGSDPILFYRLPKVIAGSDKFIEIARWE